MGPSTQATPKSTPPLSPCPIPLHTLHVTASHVLSPACVADLPLLTYQSLEEQKQVALEATKASMWNAVQEHFKKNKQVPRPTLNTTPLSCQPRGD